jgi:hypothetical protein
MLAGPGDATCHPIPLGMPWHQWSYPIDPHAKGSIGQDLVEGAAVSNEAGKVGAIAEQAHIMDLRQQLVDGKIKKKPKIFWCGHLPPLHLVLLPFRRVHARC